MRLAGLTNDEMGGASVADRDVATHSLVGPWESAWTRLVWRGVVWTEDRPRFVRQESG